MKSFKVGDRVRPIINKPDGPVVPLDWTGVVVQKTQGVLGWVEVKWDQDLSPWNVLSKSLELIPPTTEMRTFTSGATRNLDDNKLDYEGFLSPLVLERYAQYMHKHRKQADGSMRPSDNWQKGIPIKEYMKSLWRHVMDVWRHVRGLPGEDSFEDSLCAVIFNASGMLHERMKLVKKIHPVDELKSRYPEMFIPQEEVDEDGG
jgi:hypothetical protein